MKPGKYTAQSQPKVQANLTGSPVNMVRYTMNFPVTSELRGTQGLREALITIFSQMKELCSNVSIMPWKNDNATQPP